MYKKQNTTNVFIRSVFILLHHFYMYMYTICITKLTWLFKLLLHMICVIVFTILPHNVHNPSSHWIWNCTHWLMFWCFPDKKGFLYLLHTKMIMYWWRDILENPFVLSVIKTWSFTFWIFEVTDMGDITCTSLHF